MNFYEVALPVRLNKLYTYKTTNKLVKGCRVVIDFNRSLKTGIIWSESTSLSSEISYKNIIEIVDKEPIIPGDLLDLAEWMSRYYRSSLGWVLNALLPSAFNVHLQLQIKKIEEHTFDEISDLNKAVYDHLKTDEWIDIKNLNKKFESMNLRRDMELLEVNGYVRIKRSLDTKIKKKKANFIYPEIVDLEPKLTEKQSCAYQKILQYDRQIPLSELAREFNYSIIKTLKKKGMIRIEAQEVEEEDRSLFPAERVKRKITLTADQQKIADTVNLAMEKGRQKIFLLYGVTGSGKTEVYINAIHRCLDLDKTALLLVPEISLTPQLIEIFYNEFGDQIAVLHSHLKERDRWIQWQKIKQGRSRIVIGARSAIFAPLSNLGMIIVDEEHENSYKQDKNPRYNARDLAIVRAKENNSVVILGSATPSLESWNNTLKQKYKLLQLLARPLNYQRPVVKIVDLKEEKNPQSFLSQLLLDNIETRLKKKEQIILFQNRRGHSSFVQCISCGKLFTCPHCDISLNYHSNENELLCHYCGYTEEIPRKCSSCNSFMFVFGAPGTQKIEKQLRLLFPQARILRMDSDSARKKGSYDNMFQRMKEKSVDILLGTQMIAKGLDFPEVTLVGVVLADVSLNIPDFRAAERTFQLMTQVAGRSGRKNKPGQVIIQTYNPQHYAIEHAVSQNFPVFADHELMLREKLHYPPYYRIARIIFSAENEQIIKKELPKIIRRNRNLKEHFSDGELIILGPAKAPLERINKKYRYHVIYKGKSVEIISQTANTVLTGLKLNSVITTIVDIDPLNLL